MTGCKHMNEQRWEKMTPSEQQYWGMVHPFEFQKFSFQRTAKKDNKRLIGVDKIEGITPA